MKLDRARQSAEAQQAQQATGSETHRHRHSHGGYAGGMHKGVAYRHAPRAQLPAKRNTGPAPRPRPRPASTAAAGAHHEDEHPRSLADDPWAQAGGGAGGMGLMGGMDGALGGGVKGTASQTGQRSSLAQRHDPAGPRSPAEAPAPPPPARQPPVQEGAALRRSRMPEAALLRSPPREGSPLPMAALLNAYASVYFHGGDASTSKAVSASASRSAPSSASPWNSPAGSTSAVEKPGGSVAPPVNVAALRLAAQAALRRHLGPDAPSPTLAAIRASCLTWCQANGRPPAVTQAQRHANLLFPLDAFRAMFRPGSASAASASSSSSPSSATSATSAASTTPAPTTAPHPVNALLQRALEVHTAKKELSP